ncbi:M6 family metalloprotease domain-containing protein [Wenjunlia tyrosinilytica]|uniref:M6 family metalloprotease domain-containing protein n=1 Tax=Wenjunlia tyrosinilytica TaxID=1544741 RepID=A0A917ZYE9_9ACTN|nr:M6 family metalloprotease domain-containing protein [Wenjunlia tyrosinilytica]GGP00606.1 M6 family metalloprotease domain-containing protein [Wenjunlia tyrosinilytica]
MKRPTRALAAATVAASVGALLIGTDGASASSAEPAANCALPATKADLSEGITGAGPFVPSKGTVKTTMVFVDFPDAPADDTTGELYNKLVPGATDWFRTSSYGQLSLKVKADTSRFYRMPRKSTDYHFQRDLTTAEHRRYITDALRAVGRSTSFRGTQVLYIVPTGAAEAVSFSPTYMDNVTSGDGTVIGKTVTFGQDLNHWGPTVLNHETGHAMGLPDLYSYASGGSGHPYVGGWDQMGLISGHSPDRLAWHKWKQGWLRPNQVGCLSRPGTSTEVLTPVERAGGKKMAVVKTSGTRAVVAEVRSREGVDSKACATGVLIYTVDTTVDSGSGPILVQDARPNSGGCDGSELNDATYGHGGDAVTHFRDPASGATVDVTAKHGSAFTLTVRR